MAAAFGWYLADAVMAGWRLRQKTLMNVTGNGMSSRWRPLSASRPEVSTNMMPGNTIIHYKRNRVREHVLRYLPGRG